MRYFSISIFITLILSTIDLRTVRADFDVWPHIDPTLGRIITNGTDDNDPGAGTPSLRVFAYGFDQNPTNDPGFNAFDGSFPFPSEISVNVITNLQYWNGSGAVSFVGPPAGETIQLENDLTGSNFTVGGSTGFQPGFLISAVDAAGGAHKHLFSTLAGGGESGPAPGVYMLQMRVRLLNSAADSTPYAGVADSWPIFLLYNNGVSDSVLNTASDWVTTNLVPFGDFNRDHNVNADDIHAMLTTLADLKPYETTHQLTDEDLLAFGDINGDGKITNADIQGLLDLVAESGGGSVQGVPEPATWRLAIFAVAAIAIANRKSLRNSADCPRRLAGG